MILFLIVLATGLVIYFINQNKTTKKDTTTIRHTRTIKTDDGEIHINRTQTTVSTTTDYGKPDNEASPTLRTIVASVQPLPEPIKEREPIQADFFEEPQLIQTDLFEPQLEHKICPNCQRELSYDQFRKSTKHPDGYTKWCAECLSKPRDNSNRKLCPKCQKNRFKTSFYKNSKRPDGLTVWCKSCMDKSK